jgi:hypothetical protein
MEPSDLPSKHTNTDAQLSGGVHRHHHADQDFHVPEPLWATFVGRLGNLIKHLCKVGHKPDQRAVPSESGEPRHVCRLNPGYTCTCASGVCANDDATYRHARGPYLPVEHGVRAPEPNKYGNFRCPISGQLCSSTVCREWCESGVDYTKT